MNRNVYNLQDNYGSYYIDVETGERIYATDGVWVPIALRAMLALVLVASLLAWVL
jgi:hypothetical protein